MTDEPGATVLSKEKRNRKFFSFLCFVTDVVKNVDDFYISLSRSYHSKPFLDRSRNKSKRNHSAQICFNLKIDFNTFPSNSPINFSAPFVAFFFFSFVFFVNFFLQLVQDQIQQILNLNEVKQIDFNDQQSLRSLTHRITDSLKWLVTRYVKENYKVIIQVFTCSIDQENFYLVNRCLWDSQNDDVLSIEIDNKRLKFIIIIYGLEFR